MSPSRLQVSDLVQILPAAARLEAMGGVRARRLRAGIVDLLVDSCDEATLRTARVRLVQRVGEDPDVRDAALRLIDRTIELAQGHGAHRPATPTYPPAVGA